MKTEKLTRKKLWKLLSGVMGKVLVSGEKITFFYVEIDPGKEISKHRHPHEQMGIYIKGKAKFYGETGIQLVEEGTVYHFKPHESHRVKALGDRKAVFLDVFSPPREEYVKIQRSHLSNSILHPP